MHAIKGIQLFLSESSCALIGIIVASVFSSNQQLHYHVNAFVYCPNDKKCVEAKKFIHLCIGAQ